MATLIRFVPILARFIASGFGCGFAPVAPGTFGALGGLAIGALLLALQPALLPAAALVATLLGLWAVRRIGGDDDPGWITIDEVAGQLLALTPLTHLSLTGLLVAFALFRLLDILKPGPIGWADRQHGATWVMADDVIAGLIAAGILWAAQRQWPIVFQ